MDDEKSESSQSELSNDIRKKKNQVLTRSYSDKKRGSSSSLLLLPKANSKIKMNIDDDSLNTDILFKMNHKSPSQNDFNSKKRKKRRRRRRGTATEKLTKPLFIYSPSTSPSSSSLRILKQSPSSFGQGIGSSSSSSTPVLRPAGAQVPRAPENSTQFIIDDHENSFMYFGFDALNNLDDGDEGVSKSQSESKGSSPLFKYNADFESEYRSIREEEMMRCTTDELKAAIVRLEAKAAVVSDALSASPSRLLERLQVQLLALQEENKSLHAAVLKEKNKRITTSTSSSSESDSDSDSTSESSSACSFPGCEQCAERFRALDEEKENTTPKHTSSDTLTQ